MRRDMELIRELLLVLEEAAQPVTDEVAIEGHSRGEVAYHLTLIIEAGYAQGRVMHDHSGANTTVPRAVVVLRLTNQGHDLIESIRDVSVWSKVRTKLATVGGGATLDTIKLIAVAVAKQHLGL